MTKMPPFGSTWISLDSGNLYRVVVGADVPGYVLVTESVRGVWREGFPLPATDFETGRLRLATADDLRNAGHYVMGLPSEPVR